MNIGIDFGGSHIAIGIVDKDYNILDKKEHNWLPEEKENMPQTVEYYAKKFVKEITQENSNYKIEKIGIGFPSGDIKEGIIRKYNTKIDFSKILSKFNLPVHVNNDVKCSATCEKNLGSLKKYENCIFMTLGTGIGGAYFYKNELVKPNTNPGMEIGHMIIETNGKVCQCGRKGCFEAYASMNSFRRKVAELYNIDRVTSNILFDLMEKEEKIPQLNKIIDEYIYYLSIGIGNLIRIFEPEAISIGGSFSYYQSVFIEKLKEKLKEDFKDKKIPEILIAKYENDAGIIGATMLE